MKKQLLFLMLLLSFFVFSSSVSADTMSTDFENPPFVLGTANGQDGWIITGPYDQAIVSNTYGFTSFGDQSLRVSNAITSGSFGDQLFAKPLTDSVGEVDATAGSFSAGSKQSRFEMQFDIAATSPTQQTGLRTTVSPDRGDGSRMSFLRFEDNASGIDVVFFDVQGTSNPANFVGTTIATGLSRTTPHTVKLVMDVADGPSNDVVKVWIDGNLVHTGTSWENYYRYDSEAAFEQSPRIVKTVLFRQSGAAAPAVSGNGFLVDNFSLKSLTPEATTVPEITSPANGANVTSAALTKVDWTNSTGTFSPFEYQYQSFSDSGYTNLIYSSGWLTDSEIPTAGTPVGVYYLQVRAKDSEGNVTAWSNDASDPYLVTVVAEPELSVPEITSPSNGATVTVSALTKVDWTDSTGNYPPFEYQYQSFSDSSYTTLVYSSGWLTASEIPTAGTPVGNYYLQVRSKDNNGNVSSWSNEASDPYMIKVVADTIIVGPPTDKNQCKDNGWKTFNSPFFKNQGDCVSYVQSSPKAVGNKKQ